MLRGKAYSRVIDYTVCHLLEGGRDTLQGVDSRRYLHAIVVVYAVAIGVGSRDDRLETGIIGVSHLGEVGIVEVRSACRNDGMTKRGLAAVVFNCCERPTRM